MKISKDQVSDDYQYPLSKKELSKLKEIVDPAIISLIGAIRFGCNTKTTQEGRPESFFDIQISFQHGIILKGSIH
jgi:hypothetical protein